MPKAAIRTDVPTAMLRNIDIPTAKSRYSGILTNEIASKSFAGKGYLIGMLALTYIKAQNTGDSPAIFKSNDVPTARIRITD